MLRPLLLLVFINDLDKRARCLVSRFDDNSKLAYPVKILRGG